MSEIGDVLTMLGEEVIPEIAAITFPDLMTITRPEAVQDEGGAVGETTDATLYENVPVAIKRRLRQLNTVVGSQQKSTSAYDLTFPAFWDNEFMTVTADCKLNVQERSATPERVFTIEGIHQNPEGTYTAFCNEI